MKNAKGQEYYIDNTVYKLFINGYEQEVLMPFTSLNKALMCVDELRADGRIKDTDEVVLKQITIKYENISKEAHYE